MATYLVALALFPPLAAGQAEPEQIDSPRAMFRALGLDDAYFTRLTDGELLTEEEHETLWRVMYQLRRFPLLRQERWAKAKTELAAALAKPDEFRGEFFRLRGRVLKVEPCRPSEDVAERFDMTGYYHCLLELAAGDVAEVYTEKVPQAWSKGAAPNAQGGMRGVFLKLLPPEKSTAKETPDKTLANRPLFVTDRLAWYKNDLLGRLGMDCGLLDNLTDRKPILPAEEEAFYQLLAAVGSAQHKQLVQQAEKALPRLPKDWRWTDDKGAERYSVVPLFNQPETQRGRLSAFTGTARKVIKVAIDKPEIVERFGFDHYYQVSVVTDDSQGNSLTFCLRELPADMPYGNIPHYGERVRVAGFFFKSWSYRVARVSEEEPGPPGAKVRWQLSPLLIGRSLDWYPAPKPEESSLADVIVGGLFVVAMLIFWLIAWRSHRRKTRAQVF